MENNEFWLNLRTAARTLAPKVSADSPQIDEGSLRRVLQNANLWLTPRSVDDFDPKDFDFLAAEEQEKLQRDIKAFRQVAAQVPGNKPAERKHIREAGAAFAEIVRLLKPHLFRTLEEFYIQYQLERALANKLPAWVESFVCETGTDVGGDPAVWVWLNVSDRAVEDRTVISEGQRVIELVEAAVRRLKVARWPFVGFRSLPELAAARKEETA